MILPKRDARFTGMNADLASDSRNARLTATSRGILGIAAGHVMPRHDIARVDLRLRTFKADNQVIFSTFNVTTMNVPYTLFYTYASPLITIIRNGFYAMME